MTTGESGFSVWEYSAIIFAVVVVSKLISKKTKTVDVLWLIVAGAILTNLGLLPSKDDTEHIMEYDFLVNVGEWGIVFIMFALGLEEDIHHFTQGLKRSIGIAIIGALFPFMSGYFVASLVGHDHNISMIWGLTMTATAVSLTMMSLKGDNMHKSTAATGIMTAAIIDDVLSLVGLAILIPLIVVSATAGVDGAAGGVGFLDIAWVLLKVLIFFALTLFMGLIVFPERPPKVIPEDTNIFIRISYLCYGFFSRLGVRKLLLAHSGEFTPLIMLLFAMFASEAAHLLGFHAAIGAYFAGLFFHRDYFIFKEDTVNEKGEVTSTHEDHFDKAHSVIDHLAFGIFGPIFFVILGGQLVFNLDIMIKVLPIAILLFVVVMVLQVASAALAAKYTGSYKWHESIMIGLGMLGRAELAFIVINIAYTDKGIIDIEGFYTLMFTCFMLNIAVPIMLKQWKPYYLGFKKLKIGNTFLSREDVTENPQHIADYEAQMKTKDSSG